MDVILSSSSAGSGAAVAILFIFLSLFWLAIMAGTVLLIVSLWKVFAKAGEPGWAAIIPVYNYLILIRICGRELWWIALFFIPFANIVVYILLMLDLARVFGKSDGFGIGLILLPYVFVPMLAFGDARYSGVKTPM